MVVKVEKSEESNLDNYFVIPPPIREDVAYDYDDEIMPVVLKPLVSSTPPRKGRLVRRSSTSVVSNLRKTTNSSFKNLKKAASKLSESTASSRAVLVAKLMALLYRFVMLKKLVHSKSKKGQKPQANIDGSSEFLSSSSLGSFTHFEDSISEAFDSRSCMDDFDVSPIHNFEGKSAADIEAMYAAVRRRNKELTAQIEEEDESEYSDSDSDKSTVLCDVVWPGTQEKF